LIQKLNNSNSEIAVRIRTIFQVSYAVEAELLDAIDFPPLKRKLESFLESKNTFYGYYIDKVLAGVIEIKVMKESIHIQSLVVHPQFFRQKCASQLIEFTLNNYDTLFFTVETGMKNIPAIALYTKFGFKENHQWDTDHGVRKVRFERKTTATL